MKICEKPLAITRGQLDEILQAEERSKAQLGVCHQNRFNDVNVYLKEYLQANEPVVGQGYVAWERDKAYYAQAEWRGTWAQEGGGVLINQALHTLDLMQWFLGYPESVQAKIDTLALKDCIEVEDTASARCVGKVNYAFFATNASFVGNPTQINVRLKNGSQITAFRRFTDGRQGGFHGNDYAVFRQASVRKRSRKTNAGVLPLYSVGR